MKKYENNKKNEKKTKLKIKKIKETIK